MEQSNSLETTNLSAHLGTEFITIHIKVLYTYMLFTILGAKKTILIIIIECLA